MIDRKLDRAVEENGWPMDKENAEEGRKRMVG